jgi:hypothetical protein
VNRPEDDRRKADDEDAVWRDIVDSYGERPEFPDAAPPEPPPAPEPVVAFEVPHELSAATWEDEGHYVPPEPPPVPVPQGPRAVAWAGVLGMPLLMLVLVIVGWSPPSPTGLLMVVWFVGGFGYLVATMRGSDDEGGWDDDNGAVL